MEATQYKMRLRNAAQVVQVCAQGESFKTGASMKEVCVLDNATIVVDSTGIIVDVGPEADLCEKYANATFQYDLDLAGKSVVPGLCDGHTHPVFSGDRVNEFAMKLEGATYLEVHAAGGGINFTVECTRKSSEEELLDLYLKRLDRQARDGTCLTEAKSGYGLDAETEAKMLRVLHKADQAHPVHIVSNFCGAHSVPKGSTPVDAARDVIDHQIPAIMRLKEEGLANPTLIDVFMEKGVFGAAETAEILEAGVAAGLEINFHGDEIHYTGSAELGGRLGALAISHLEQISDEGIAALAVRPTVAVLLPTTAHVLQLPHPPARKLIEAAVPVALGSDFNPNAHCMSMPFVMNLACVLFRMSMAESLVAATINSAASMGQSASFGSIEVGKRANFVVVAHEDWRHLIYEMVDPPIDMVVIDGAPLSRE